MISDLCNWQSTFINKDSKWIDECSNSADRGEVILKNWEISEKTNQALIGGAVPDGRGCWQFANWTKWTPYVAQLGFDAFKTLVADSSSHIDSDYDTFALNSVEDTL